MIITVSVGPSLFLKSHSFSEFKMKLFPAPTLPQFLEFGKVFTYNICPGWVVISS